MAALIKSQTSSKASIEKSYENFKKSPKDRLAKTSYLQTRLDILEEQWTLVTETHRKLSMEGSDAIFETKYFKEDIFSSIEEIYILYKSDLKDALSLLTPAASLPNEAAKNESNVNLPKISIPIFSGMYNEWPTFRDMYVSLIHTNASLDNVQNMHYLKGHLSGEAAQLLRHVPITAASYQDSWLLLNNRYNNKKYLTNGLLKRFINQPNIGTESCSAIKEMLDLTNDTINGLKNLGINVDTWDVIIIYIISTKLDSESRKQWEAKISAVDELPTLNQMREFLESKFRSLEFLDGKQRLKPNFSNHKPKAMHATATVSNVTLESCIFCKQNHRLSNYKEFAKTNYDARFNFVQTNGLCFNCLGSKHSSKVCRSHKKCHICKHKHHSLLHPNPKPTSGPCSSDSQKSLLVSEVNAMVSNVKASLDSSESASNFTSHFSKETAPNQILLATALVESRARNGYTHLFRALLDQGSQASFVTESAVQLLGLRKIPNKSIISGLGGDNTSVMASKYIVMMDIQSRHDPSFQVSVRAHVLGAITSLLPSEKVLNFDWPELNNITLADPQFHIPSKIDILLGADIYGDLIREGLIKGPRGMPTAQNTALGWILSGPTHQGKSIQSQSAHCHHNLIVSSHFHNDDNELLKKFWEIENYFFDTKILTKEEQLCEDLYEQTTRRDASGRYIVRLPFREDDPKCKYGNSREIAIKRFQLLEKRLKKDAELKNKYSEVIHEYLDLGHMVRISDDDKRKHVSVYLPHHAVIREDKSTTKVRVVFDALCKGNNGISLNDTLMIGPKLQQDLRHIILKWRMHPICLSADIVKMYRQIIVAEEDVDFQRLVWRDSPESEMEEYRLERVTFGTASAPYLAVKTLQRLAIDEGSAYPLVAEKVKKDYYVDDLLT
ncbi:unnamed protein product [Parnassius mnemosyne]|uniref:Peptidase A2 domain-containing protein n=1 Tax=Parnassius mnemosyne TaxID=213953 RepID=A0AAV1KKF4_9NEOP